MIKNFKINKKACATLLATTYVLIIGLTGCKKEEDTFTKNALILYKSKNTAILAEDCQSIVTDKEKNQYIITLKTGIIIYANIDTTITAFNKNIDLEEKANHELKNPKIIRLNDNQDTKENNKQKKRKNLKNKN